jgi:hypothetical protein
MATPVARLSCSNAVRQRAINLFREIKTAFDPLGILNPGVKLDPTAAPLARLKVGPDTDSLPDDIAAGLREVERTGGYALSRLALAGRDPGVIR